MPLLNLASTVELNYAASGSGPALLFFNGATLPLEFWDPVVTGLEDRYQCIRLDQRNAGSTRYDGSFTLNDVAADAAALLDHLAVETAVVIGHAWGGRAAQVFARDHPHRCRGLVVCGTGGALPATVTAEDLELLRDAARSGNRASWEQLLEAIYCASGYRARDPGGFAEIAGLLWGHRPPGRASWDNRVSPSASYWGQTRLPALLIYGREDRNGTPANAEHLLATITASRSLPEEARLEFIESAGHFVIREAPERVTRLIDGFARSR